MDWMKLTSNLHVLLYIQNCIHKYSTYIRRYIHCAYVHEHVITFDTNLQLFMLPKVACTLSFLLVKQEFIVLRLWVLKIYMHPCANPDAEYFKFLRFGNELCKRILHDSGNCKMVREKNFQTFFCSFNYFNNQLMVVLFPQLICGQCTIQCRNLEAMMQ